MVEDVWTTMKIAPVTTWERTGELRWFPRSKLQAASFELYEAWHCREDGRVRWEKIKTATPDEIRNSDTWRI
jgi:hypothetical protein